MLLKSGQKLASTVCTTQVMVIKAPATPLDVRCGGQPVALPGEPASGAASVIAPDHAGGSLLGKRYVNEDGSIELLVVKAGEGSLSVDGKPLAVKAAKALPSSD
ncbi:MAG: hypothetical protein Q8N17_25180 [Burkholderiaceae bacterium]|nr:hypothetical protein [Burkholderiaceae bacterium]